MPDPVTITDFYGDSFEVCGYDSSDGFSIDVNPTGEDDVDIVTYFAFPDRDAAVDVIDALSEIVGHTPNVAAGAVRASDVSFNEALVRLAIAHNREVEFSYAKADGSIIELRRLQPASLREVKGHVTITGYDPDRDEPRAYRLDRIKGEVSI